MKLLKQVHKDDQRARIPLLLPRKAEEAGLVQSVKKKAFERSHCNLSAVKGILLKIWRPTFYIGR